jgi:hypothetical protein
MIEGLFFFENCHKYDKSLDLTIDAGYDVLQSIGVACMEHPIKSLT